MLDSSMDEDITMCEWLNQTTSSSFKKKIHLNVLTQKNTKLITIIFFYKLK